MEKRRMDQLMEQARTKAAQMTLEIKRKGPHDAIQERLLLLTLTAVHIIGLDLADKIIFNHLFDNQIDQYMRDISDGIHNEANRIIDCAIHVAEQSQMSQPAKTNLPN